MYFERLNRVPRHPSASRGIGRYVLDSTQAVADGVRAAINYFSRTAQGSIIVLPHRKRFEKQIPFLVGKVVKTVQRSADRLIHQLRRADCGGGMDRSASRSGSSSSVLRSQPPSSAAASYVVCKNRATA
jgi:hypothetical protein